MILRLNNQVGLENIAVCAFVGETLELNCATDDNAMVPLEITAPDGSMATGSLIVSSVDMGDEGTYSCRLSNDPGPCGQATEQREVRVFKKKIFYKHIIFIPSPSPSYFFFFSPPPLLILGITSVITID